MSGNNSTSLPKRLEFLGFTKEQLEDLKTTFSIVDKTIDQGLTDFYQKISVHPDTSHFFPSQSIIQHAKTKQGEHWRHIASGKLDDDYTKSVTTIGNTHARIGLEPRWYIGGYALIVESIIHAIVKDQIRSRWFGKVADKVSRMVSSVVKVSFLDMDYAISVYLETLRKEREDVQAAHDEENRARDHAMSVIATHLQKLADGDLTAKITADISPKYQSLKENFNTVVESLNNTISDIRYEALEAATNVEHLTVATDDLSRRTEAQAASLEQSSAALTEITAISTQSASRTKETQAAVIEVTEKTIQSREVVNQTIDAMSEIEGSSKKITDIIDVIDDISFQTNLLALNAGVEAARAGDAGKGFAVVAQEVRALAQRSASQAKEIKLLITKSSDDVAKGVALVNETGEALKAIAVRIESIKESISSLAFAASEQQTGINEINIAVSNMDNVTQQNAAMVEQANAATHSLSQIVQNFIGMIDKFKTE